MYTSTDKCTMFIFVKTYLYCRKITLKLNIKHKSLRSNAKISNYVPYKIAIL